MGAKKGRIGLLQKGWEHRLLEAAEQNEITHKATYALGIATIWATGCRPSELAKGIKIRQNAGYFEFTISGAKVGKTGGVAGDVVRGSSLRVLKIKNTSLEWCKCLSREFEKTGQKWLEVKTSSADTIATQIRRVAKREWPDLPAARLPSAYSFRHSMGRDLKNHNESPEKIARILGHASTFSQKRYGRWSKGGSKGPARSIEATSSTQPRGSKVKPDKSGLTRFKQASAAKTRTQARKLRV